MSYWDVEDNYSSRECFRRETAAKVLAGFAGYSLEPLDRGSCVSAAVEWADALLAELEKPTEAKP